MKLRTTTMLSLVALGACGPSAGDRTDGDIPAVDVSVSTPRRGGATVTFPATVVARNRAEIATRTSGSVERVEVDVGDRVRAGDVLVTLAASDLDARTEAAEARLKLAQRAHGRMDRLAAAGAASRSELDVAVMELSAAEAAATDARAQAAYATLRAPFAGIVVRRDVDPGDLAVPGRPLLALVGPGARTLRADVPSAQADRIGVGKWATAEIEGIAGPVPVRVSRVSEALTPGTRTRQIEADLPGTTVTARPGAWARLTFQVSSRNEGAATLWIPADAVIERGQLRGVYTVRADTVRLRWIRTGREAGDAVEMLAGPTTPLVRRPDSALRDGAPIRTVTEEPFVGAIGDLAAPDPSRTPS